MPIKAIKTSYNSGEQSEYMAAREDVNKYHNGASKMINATVLPHGGFVKRSGTEFIATALNKSNLIPFEFSVDDALVLEYSNLLLRFYKNGAAVTAKVGTEDLSGLGNLVAHWLLNDNLATTVVLDDDGGTHNGVATSNTQDLHASGIDGAGSGSLDLGDTDVVEVAHSANFSFIEGANGDFSIIAFVNYVDIDAGQMILSKWEEDTPEREWNFQINSAGFVNMTIYDETNNEAVERTSNVALTPGIHLICMTYEGEDGTWSGATAGNFIKLYVDGALVASTATNNASYVKMVDGGATTMIGGLTMTGPTVTPSWFDRMDNVAVFSDVLTPAEIAALISTQPYSIVSPFTSAQAFDIHVTQSADVMYIAHKDVHPKKLSRLGATDWTIEDVPFKGGPFLDDNLTSAFLLGFARTGGTARSEYLFPKDATGTLTATGRHSPFNSSMVGGLFLIKHARPDATTTTFAKDTNVTPTVETFASGAIRIKGDYIVTVEPVATGKEARLWRKQGEGIWTEHKSFRGASSFSSSEDEDDVFFAMTRSDNTIKGTLTAQSQINRGIVKITSFTSPTVVNCIVVDPVLSNNSSNAAVTTSMWAEGAWSDFRGYPRTVVFFEDRLWWASSTNNPDALWSSKSGLYENMSFSALGLDDEAITFPINDNEVSQIQWMQARQVMAVGAANKEYRFGNPDPDKAVTPLERKATPQTSEGSHTIQPVILKDSIFFFQRLGRKLGKMKFDAITENFDVEDSTMLTYRLFDSAPVDMTVQRVPDSIIWSVRTDGVMPTLTYEPKEEVLGWARQIFGNSAAVETPTGTVESVAVIHGSAEDEVWVSVLWASLSARHIMRFKPRDFGDVMADAFYVDSGITATPAGTTVSGLDHLDGEDVVVLGDGVVQSETSSGDFTVTSGNITVPSGLTTVQAGLPYTMKVRTMRHSIPQEGTTIQSRIKKIERTNIRYIRSLGGQAGQEYAGVEHLQNIEATFSTAAQDTVPNNRLTQGGYSEDAFTTIISSDPVPFTALAAIIDIEVEK